LNCLGTWKLLREWFSQGGYCMTPACLPFGTGDRYELD